MAWSSYHTAHYCRTIEPKNLLLWDERAPKYIVGQRGNALHCTGVSTGGLDYTAGNRKQTEG